MGHNFKKVRKYIELNYLALLSFIGMLIISAFVIALIFVVIIGVHYCAQEPKFEGVNDVCTYIEHFILDNAPVVGIISGFVGIIAAFWCFRPQFDISNTLIWTNTNRLQVSVSNNFFFSKLTDISIEMDFIREERDGRDIRTKKIEMNKDDVSILYGCLAGIGKSSTYLFHSASGFVWNDKYDKIRCRVTAVHHMSGIKRIKEAFFTQDQLKRGKLQDGQFISQVNMYTLPGQETCAPEIESMCHKLQAVCEEISYAVIPVDFSKKAEIIERIDISLKTTSTLEYEELQTMFPCLKNNADTIEHLATKLAELQNFYKTKKNLNPENKAKRKELIDDISKYIVFLGDQMNRDIDAKYKSLNS